MSHKDLASVAPTVPQPCPTPEKLTHVSRAEAKRHAKKHQHRGDHVRPYLCVCLRWHVGHLPYAARRGFLGADSYYGRSA